MFCQNIFAKNMIRYWRYICRSRKKKRSLPYLPKIVGMENNMQGSSVDLYRTLFAAIWLGSTLFVGSIISYWHTWLRFKSVQVSKYLGKYGGTCFFFLFLFFFIIYILLIWFYSCRVEHVRFMNVGWEIRFAKKNMSAERKTTLLSLYCSF